MIVISLFISKFCYYTYNNVCVTKINYIMNNVQDYSVLYNNAVFLDKCGDDILLI
jgi:hypothetical protein